MTTFPGAPTPWGNETSLNITAATIVKGSWGVPVIVQVLTAGSTAGAVYDSSSVTGNSASNQVATIPNTVGFFPVQIPCATGIVVSPGTGQVISISYI